MTYGPRYVFQSLIIVSALCAVYWRQVWHVIDSAQ